MRSLLVVGLCVLLTACGSFHPRNPPWRKPLHAAPSPMGETTASPLRWKEIGTSVQGRSIRTVTLGTGSRKVLWVGGIHGDEREGAHATASLPRAFREAPGAADRVTLTILEDVNPDGTALGVRWNANGVDLNRNYPAANFQPTRRYGSKPLNQPESKLLHDLILDLKPDLVIVAHSWRGDHFINFDGPAEHLAERFSKLSEYRVQTSDEIAPTPGSLGSWVGRENKIPILTLEYLRGRDPVVAWNETREAILSVILEG